MTLPSQDEPTPRTDAAKAILKMDKEAGIIAFGILSETLERELAALTRECERLKEQQRWIPVSERLPDELNKHFLLFGDGPSIEDCVYVGYLTNVRGPKEWREITGHCVMQPRYWKPLPEPPK